MIRIKESRMKLRISGYDRVFRLSQYMGESHPEAHLKGLAGSMIIALLCNKYEANFLEVSIRQMYKVFFNDRAIFLDDSIPDMTKVGGDYVCAFENITDLKPQVRQFLEPDKAGNLYIFHDDQESLFRTFSQCFRNIPAAGGLVRNPAGEVLVIFRKGKWDLPKGKKEDEESIEQTAVREVEEECGLKGIEIREFLRSTYHIYGEPRNLILKKTDWFSMIYAGSSEPKPATKEGITEIRWIRSTEVDEVCANTYPAIEEIIREAF